jgi:hypothetical protein
MPLPATELDKISIEQAEGTVLDLSKVTAGATIVSGVWAFIAVNHKVKLMITGTKNNGEALNQVVWPWPSSHVNQNWVNSGRYAHTLAYNYINDLADGSRLELHFKAALTLSQVEAEAIDAPVKVYMIRALDLKEPRIKEASDDSLDPFAASDTLTAVIPAYTNMIGTQVSVTWSGTSGEGSVTVGPIDVTAQADKEIPLPNSVVPFNLGKTVKVTCTVTRNGTLLGSKEVTLTVQPIVDGDNNLPTPTIDGAVSDELDVTRLEETAQLRIAKWLLQALNQNVWLRYDGFDGNGDAVELVFWAGAAHKQVEGLLTAARVAWLRELKDESPLAITFKLNFDKVANTDTTVSFPVRNYIVKNVLAPLIENFDLQSSISLRPGDSKDIESMIITNLQGQATVSIIPMATPYPGKIEGKVLSIDGAQSTTSLNLKATYTKVEFWYADVSPSNAVKAIFYKNEIKLGEKPFETSVSPKAFQIVFEGEGITKIEIVTQGSDVIYLDSFTLG